VNHHHGPIRLHLIGQPLVGIELGFDCAVELAVANGQAQQQELDADARRQSCCKRFFP